ncbi:MAG: hypothetical protein N2745_06630 [Syntrophorhabdaceae bacterium]|nr:hypothetical protein [Syntrophorhabdaceae bacterium]
MKKVSVVILMLLIGIVLVSNGFTQGKPEGKPEEKKAPSAPEKAPVKTDKPEAKAEQKATPEKPKAPAKPKGVFVGKVYSVNDKTKTLTVTSNIGTPGERGDVTFDVKDAKFIGYTKTEDISIGDTVSVRYTKDGAEVKKIAGKVPSKGTKK